MTSPVDRGLLAITNLLKYKLVNQETAGTLPYFIIPLLAKRSSILENISTAPHPSRWKKTPKGIAVLGIQIVKKTAVIPSLPVPAKTYFPILDVVQLLATIKNKNVLPVTENFSLGSASLRSHSPSLRPLRPIINPSYTCNPNLGKQSVYFIFNSAKLWALQYNNSGRHPTK